MAPATYEVTKKDHDVREVKVASITTFDYQKHHYIKTILAIIALPISLIIGCTLKGLAYISSETRANHRAIEAYKNRGLDPTDYKALGIDQVYTDEPPKTDHQPRQPIDEKDVEMFEVEKLAAQRTFEILNAHQIPCWLDCGSALGVYRHGDKRLAWDRDVDIAILAADHQNVFRLLQKELDEKYPGEYDVQDWSAFALPQTKFRLVIKKNNSPVDIYTYKVLKSGDERLPTQEPQSVKEGNLTLTVGGEVIEIPNVDKHKVFEITPDMTTVQYQFSEKGFMPESWKVRERVQMLERPITSLFPLRKAQFDGIDVRVPNDLERWCQRTYGVLYPTKVYDPETKKYIQVMGHPYWENHDFNSSME